MGKSVACALVGARLDSVNSLLFGVSLRNVASIQRAQNAASGYSRLGLQALAAYRVKIARITYKTIYTMPPDYLHSLLKHYVPSRTLRSLGLFVPASVHVSVLVVLLSPLPSF